MLQLICNRPLLLIQLFVQETMNVEQVRCSETVTDDLSSSHANPEAPPPINEIPATIEGRLALAHTLKEEGNEFFRQKEWKKAAKKYHYTLLYCKGVVDKLDFIPGLAATGRLRATREQETEGSELLASVYNNLAGIELCIPSIVSVYIWLCVCVYISIVYVCLYTGPENYMYSW